VLLRNGRVRLLGRWQGNAACSEQHASSFDSKNNAPLVVAVHTKAIRHSCRLQYIAVGNKVVILATHLHVAMFLCKREESNVLFVHVAEDLACVYIFYSFC
jgi:hypothetical protein